MTFHNLSLHCLDDIGALSAATSFLAPQPDWAPAHFARPNIIPRITPDRWNNGSLVIGQGELVFILYHGCFGISEGEKQLVQCVRQIEAAGGPSIAIMLPQRSIMPNDPVKGHHIQQARKLKAVVDGFSEEDRSHLPDFITSPSLRARASGTWDVVKTGTQQWHEIVFKTENGVTIPDIDKTEPLMHAAGAEVTGMVEEARRSEGFRDYIVGGFSFGVAMASHHAFFRPVDPESRLLGGLFDGAPFLRQACHRQMYNQNLHGTITLHANDPIPEKALGHTVKDVQDVVHRSGMCNIRVVEASGGHEMDYELSGRQFAQLVNRYYRFGRPIHLTPS